jgi:transposase
MYIDTSKTTINGKTYHRYLFRESYREDGKVKNRTLGKISKCSEAEVAAIKLALKYKDNLSALLNIEDVELHDGLRVGVVYALKTLAERLGLSKALGRTRQGKLALWQIMARLIGQGSRMGAVRMAASYGACDVLELESFTEDDLYANLAWLMENQERIEKQLFKHNSEGAGPELLLYDVTSSYLEGMENVLAAFGYNRDGKKGKKQIVIGLLCTADGDPVAVRVFAGNTGDKSTVAEQIRTVANTFGIEEITMVGDKGMIKTPQAKDLTDAGFHYITSLSKPEIRTLLKAEVLQMDFFDSELYEVENKTDCIRYVLRKNPVREVEMTKNRQERVNKIQRFVDEKSSYLTGSVKRDKDVALRFLQKKINQHKLNDVLELNNQDRVFKVTVNEEMLKETALLDGCYVIKTDVKKEILSTKEVHDRYKDLAKVEHAFRTFKQSHLEIRPVHVRTEASTRGHVFAVMLAYKIERLLSELWKKCECTVPEGIDELGAIRSTIITLKEASCQKIPQSKGLAGELLAAAGITLPSIVDAKKVVVVTRKKLALKRK